MLVLSNFNHIVKAHLSHLPKDDYPVLDTFKFVSIWLSLVMDQSQTSMRSLFKRLNLRGEGVDISTFSKASRYRGTSVFEKLILSLKQALHSQGKVKPQERMLFPLDSTIISLTSTLMWELGYHQVKLFSGINLSTEEPGGITIHFGQGHDNKYGNETIAETPVSAETFIQQRSNQQIKCSTAYSVSLLGEVHIGLRPADAIGSEIAEQQGF